MNKAPLSNHPQPLDLSIIILTLNEQDRIERCLASLPDGAEVIVFDSGSEDDTISKAQNWGAMTYERPFTDYAEQRNAATAKATRSWVFMLDADEYLSQSLKKFLESELQMPAVSAKLEAFAAYRVTRRLIFLGKTMRWGKSSDRPIRLFKRGLSRFEGSIHESLQIPKKRCGYLGRGLVWHESYADLSDYFHRFNRYTSAIASQHMQGSKSFGPLSFVLHLIRPWTEFISRYFFRLGFLDGYPGYTYALLSSLYAYVKYAKLYELRQSLAQCDGKKKVNGEL